jgi:hypothetical protein
LFGEELGRKKRPAMLFSSTFAALSALSSIMSKNCLQTCCLGKEYACTTHNALCCALSPLWCGCLCVKSCCLETMAQQQARRAKETQVGVRNLQAQSAAGMGQLGSPATPQPQIVYVQSPPPQPQVVYVQSPPPQTSQQ